MLHAEKAWLAGPWRVSAGANAQHRLRRTNEEHWSIIPAYDQEQTTGKGPRLLTPDSELIRPELLAMKLERSTCVLAWFETKHTTHGPWYRRACSWQTAIDLRHALDDLKEQEQTGREVFLCFSRRGHTFGQRPNQWRSRCVPKRAGIDNRCVSSQPEKTIEASISAIADDTRGGLGMSRIWCES